MKLSIAKRVGGVAAVFSFLLIMLGGFFSMTPTSVEAELAFHDSSTFEQGLLFTDFGQPAESRIALVD